MYQNSQMCGILVTGTVSTCIPGVFNELLLLLLLFLNVMDLIKPL